MSSGYYLSGISELDYYGGDVVGDAYYPVVTMKMILIGQKYFYQIQPRIRSQQIRSQRVIGRDRFVIKNDRIGSDEIRKSSNALRDSISAF